MKIISKFKDYYDYLQGIYGVDPKKILDRTEFYSGYLPDIFRLYFCGDEYIRYTRKSWNTEVRPFLGKKYRSWSLPRHFEQWELRYSDHEMVWYKTNQHVKTDVPYMIHYWGKSNKFPILKDIGFDKVMNPKDCYLAIEEYISYVEPPVPNKPEDMQRFEGKGFDKKTSFRNIK